MTLNHSKMKCMPQRTESLKWLRKNLNCKLNQMDLTLKSNNSKLFYKGLKTPC